MQTASNLKHWGGATFVALALAGCAATTVQVEGESADKLPRPSVVLVHRFAVNASEVTENQGFFQKAIDSAEGETSDEKTAQIARDVSESLADALVQQINSLGITARRTGAGESGPEDSVVISGYFIDINQGNRAQRLVIGLGAGQATVDTQVYVRQRMRHGWKDVVDFTTHADSGAMPGAAITMGAGAAASGGVTAGMAAANAGLSGVKAYRSQVDQMAGRSANRAADTLSQVFAQQGWIPPDRVRTPLVGN
jgi:hypothetical protein